VFGKFDSDGVEIAYFDEGEGKPTLLIHGFASNFRVNWASTSWVAALVADGRRVVGLDNRGHGDSGKPHDRAAYAIAEMAEDARRLLDHLGIGRADVIGYSMGARIAAQLAIRHPARVRRVVFGGMGDAMVRSLAPPEPIADALLAESAADVDDPVALGFRTFADRTKSDRKALAACVVGARNLIDPATIGTIRAPVLIAVGSDDAVAGSAAGLAAMIPGARVFEIPHRDHMKAVGDPRHKAAAIAFLDEPD
jgi:pimeloyl-ACP methyl ester carboxylesterase